MNHPISRRDLVRLLGAATATGVLPERAHAAPWLPTDRKKVNMIVRSQRPLDLEMPLDGFLNEWTPVERFFTRSHHNEPKVDLSTWQPRDRRASSRRLRSSTLRNTSRRCRSSKYRRFSNAPATAVVFFEPSMAGIQWEYGAVGNAKWIGVRLADILKLAGADERRRSEVLHRRRRCSDRDDAKIQAFDSHRQGDGSRYDPRLPNEW